MAQGSKRLLRGTVRAACGSAESSSVAARSLIAPRYTSKTAEGGVGDADETLRELLDEVGTGKHDASDTTVGHLLKRIRPVLGNVPPNKLDPETLDSFYGRLAKDKLSPASIRQVHAILRAAWEAPWISSNPHLVGHLLAESLPTERPREGLRSERSEPAR